MRLYPSSPQRRESILSVLVLCLLFFIVSPAHAYDTIYNPKDVIMKAGATSTVVTVSGIVTDYEAWRSWYDGNDDTIKKIYAHFSFSRSVSMPTKYPGTAVNDSTVGTVGWSNPSYALSVDDGLSASVVLNGSTSNYIKLINFGFNISSLATLKGIKISDYGTCLSSCNQFKIDNSIKLVVGGVISGIEKATGAQWIPGSYGGTSDLWQLTLSPADLNANNFGVVLSARESSGTSTTFTLSYLSITPYYSVPMSWRWQVRNRIPGSAWVDLHSAVTEQWDWNTTVSTKDVIFEALGQHIPFDLRLVVTKTTDDTINLTFTPTGSALELIGY